MRIPPASDFSIPPEAPRPPGPAGVGVEMESPPRSEVRLARLLGLVLARRWLLERDGLAPAPPDDPGAARRA